MPSSPEPEEPLLRNSEPASSHNSAAAATGMGSGGNGGDYPVEGDIEIPDTHPKTTWRDKYDINLIGLMMADEQSDEDLPMNVRFHARVNKLQVKYRDYKDHSKSYHAKPERWNTFKRGELIANGWVQTSGGKWTKPGALPPVKLPKKVEEEMSSKGPLPTFSASDVRYLTQEKKKHPVSVRPNKKAKTGTKAPMTTIGKKPAMATPRMRKPAASSTGSKVKKVLKKPAASSSSRGKRGAWVVHWESLSEANSIAWPARTDSELHICFFTSSQVQNEWRYTDTPIFLKCFGTP